MRRTSPADVLRSLAFYLLFYGVTVLLAFVVTVQLLLPGRTFVRTIFLWTRFHRLLMKCILGIRVRIEGRAPTGAVLVALRHESFYEAIDLPVLLDYPVVFAKIELLRLPLWGRAGRHYGLIGVDRDQGARALRAMMAEARALSGEGRPMAIFPEGTRVPHGVRAPLQAGFSGIYKMLGLPVVPVAVDSGPLYQGRWKRPGTITVRFGEAIPPGLPRPEVEARVLEGINALNPAPRP